MLMTRPQATADVTAAAPKPPAQAGILFQGLLVQLTNPKNLLFVLAFLPQFISAQRPLLPQLGIMLAVTVIIDAAVLLGYSLLAARGARALKGSRFIAWLERAFGAALIFFGIRLLLSQK
jgi:homoserine/homoserine lactone efflux protein